MKFDPSMSLQEARDLLRTLVEDGHRCPCCTQFAKVYRRKIHSRMAADLITFWRIHGREWGHSTRTLGATAPDFTKLVHWGMIEPLEGERDDGSSRVGWWRVTTLGAQWLSGGTTVFKYALLYDGRCLGNRGELVTIYDALGKKFRYDELMAGV